MKKLPDKIEANIIVIFEAVSTALRDKRTRTLIGEDLDLTDEVLEDILDDVLAYLTGDYASGWGEETHPTDLLSKEDIARCLKDCSPAVKAAINQPTKKK